MSIKLKGSSDGSVSFDAPADTSPSGSDITLTLPTSAGSANQFLKNSGIAGELEYSSTVEDSSGRLLVGTASSTGSHILEVNGGTDNEPIKVVSSDAGAYITFADDDTTGSTRLGAVDDDFKIDVNSGERLRITSAGKIQVTGTRGGSLQPSDNDTLELFTSASNGNADTGCGLSFYNNDGNGAEIGGTIQVAKENGSINNTAGYMRFSTRANNSDPAERMRITSGGHILANTTSVLDLGSGTTSGINLNVNNIIVASRSGVEFEEIYGAV